MTQITTYTTNEEVQAIYSAYRNEDGTIDFAAIEADILDGVNPDNFSREDLVTAYVTGTGTLPSFMMAPEASIPDPDADAVEGLWSDPVVASLQQLGDTMVSSEAYDNAVRDFLAYGGVSGTVAESEAFISYIMSQTGESEEGAEELANTVKDLFNVEDLTEIMHLFMQMGNVGFALLLFTAYGLNPAMQELQEAALEVMDDLSTQQGDLLGQIEGIADSIGPDDLGAQYDAQVITQQLDVIKTVLQTMSQFIVNAQDAMKQSAETASNLSASFDRMLDSIIRNMA